MRPTLILQPIHNSSADIIKSFINSAPLSCDQKNFLEWHQREISNAWYDPILSYYLQSHRRHPKQYQGTFLLPFEEINFEAIQSLKKRINASLRDQYSHIAIPLTQKQFLQFKHYGVHELIFWHGNQFLTGAPFYPSGVPPVIYFQWGNLFGVVKYLVLSTDKALKANILVYFEDMQDRDLDRCVADYNYHLEEKIKLQKEITCQKEQAQSIENPTKSNEMRLTPSHYFLAHPF